MSKQMLHSRCLLMAPEWTAQDGQVLGPLPPTCKTQGSSWNLALAVVAIWGVIMGERYIPFSFSLCLSNTICEKSLNMITYHQKYSSFSFSSTYLEDKGWKNKIILYSFFQRSIFTYLRGRMTERRKEGPRQAKKRSSVYCFIPQMATAARVGTWNSIRSPMCTARD